METKSSVKICYIHFFHRVFKVNTDFLYNVERQFPLLVLLCLVAQSCPTLGTPWTVAHQAPLSLEFSRQEDWSGLPFPTPGDLSNPGIELRSSALQADS